MTLRLGRWATRYEPGRVLRRLYWGGYIWTPFVHVHATHG